MKKPWIGILVGALVYFGWGSVSWMLLPWHNHTIKKLPEEQLISDTLKTVVTDTGFYSFPYCSMTDGASEQKTWTEKVRKGPVGTLIFSPAGKDPMCVANFVFGFIAALLVSAVTMLVLFMSRDRVKGILPRAVYIMLLGLAVAFAVHFPYWLWFGFPMDFTLVAMADELVSFLLLGLAQAVFVPRS